MTREVVEETGARVQIMRIVAAYGGEPVMVEYRNGDRDGYVTVAYECQLLSPSAPDMDELLERGRFHCDAIAELPLRAWIDRVIADTPR